MFGFSKCQKENNWFYNFEVKTIIIIFILFQKCIIKRVDNSSYISSLDILIWQLPSYCFCVYWIDLDLDQREKYMTTGHGRLCFVLKSKYWLGLGYSHVQTTVFVFSLKLIVPVYNENNRVWFIINFIFVYNGYTIETFCILDKFTYACF